MKREKVRREKLSIYLAKSHDQDDSKLLSVENAQPPITLALLKGRGLLYIKKETPKVSPPWTKLFVADENVPAGSFGFGSTVGAALVVRAFERTFILTFGSGHHLLNTDAIERDFGLRVTLNSVEPEKLRSLDKASYDHNPLNSRTQSTSDVDIFDLDIDSELEILYAVTGASKVPIFGSHVTGRDALTIAAETTLQGIPAVLEEAKNRFEAKLPSTFEWVDNIHKVKDRDDIEILDLMLDDLLRNPESENLWIGEPEIVDWEGQVGYSFDLYSRTDRLPVLRMKDLAEYVHSKHQLLNVETLKSQQIHVNNSEYQSVKHWSAYRCLYAEIVAGSEQYILRNGVWFEVDQDFAGKVDRYLSDITTYSFKFPKYAYEREDEYNMHLAEGDATFKLMDKNNIRIGGPYDKLEFCDLIKDGVDLIHVKYFRSSSTLSHLFSQGQVAAEAFVRDADFRARLNAKLPESARLSDAAARPDPSAYRVVYAIATHKALPSELPFFSKVTLKNAVKILRALDFKVEISAIEVDPALFLKKKCKPLRG